MASNKKSGISGFSAPAPAADEKEIDWVNGPKEPPAPPKRQRKAIHVRMDPALRAKAVHKAASISPTTTVTEVVIAALEAWVNDKNGGRVGDEVTFTVPVSPLYDPEQERLLEEQ